MLLIRSIILAGAVLFSISTRAHVCGVRNIDVAIGSAVIWNIEADLEEVQSLYTPVSLGDTNIALITPGRQFLAHDAYFAIFGRRVGTTTISYHWFYARTGFSGTCTVTVNVREPQLFSGNPSLNGMSGLPIYIYSQYFFSQNYIFTPTTLPPGTLYDSRSGTFFWVPNPLGFFILTGQWALFSNPSQTFPLASHFLISPRQALSLDADWKYSSYSQSSKLEFCLNNPLGGPITLERTANLRDWFPVATFDSTPNRELRALTTLPAATYRTRLGAPALQLGADPEYFRFPIPKNFSANSRLYWSIGANDEGPSLFQGPLSPYNGRFVMPLDPLDLPSRGNLYFTIQDALQTTAVMSQPFEKITGAPLNSAPMISGLPSTLMIPRSGQPKTFRFTVTDDRTFPNLLEFHPISMNQSVVPDFYMQARADADGNGTITINAFPNQTGSVPIHVQVFDGSLLGTQLVTLQIVSNTEPDISRISDVYTPMNTESPVINFTVTDVETAPGSLTLTPASSDTNLVRLSDIVINGTGTNRTLLITPTTGSTGTTTITITVTDAGGSTDQTSFDVNVRPVMRNYYDFNWDTKTDLILQDDTGALAAWYMTGAVRIAEAPLNPATTGTKDWLCIGAGFFDNDRRGDLLFQYTDGALATWHLDGINLKHGSFLTPMFTDPGWSAVAVTDLNRDGHSDILLQHMDGRISGWQMHGTERQAVINFADQPPTTPGALPALATSTSTPIPTSSSRKTPAPSPSGT